MSQVKRVITPFPVLTADVSTNPISVVTDVTNLDYGRYDIEWSGAAIDAVVELQYLKDGEAVWKTLDLGASVPITGNSGSHEIVLREMPFEKLRLVTTHTSGAGTISAFFCAKQR